MVRHCCALAACSIMLLVAGAAAGVVQATIISDGPHAVYAGAADGTGMELVGASVTSGSYDFDIPDDRYIYVLVWGQGVAARGLLGEFILGGVVVLSGDPAWEAYRTELPLRATDPPPGPSAVAEQVRTANRRFAWQAASILGLNSADHPQLSADAAWMWTPESGIGVAHSTAGQGAGVIFRISPNKLWPEIELWHGHNAGRGPLRASSTWGSHTSGLGGGGGGSGSGSGGPSRGSGAVPPIGQPFRDFEPPNSFSTPPVVPTEQPIPPRLPSTGDKRPTERVPPTDDDDQHGRKPPEDMEPRPPISPPVPEPSAVLTWLVAAAVVRRRG